MSETNDESQFALQRLYVKDLSFESPKAVEAFQKQWQPEINLDLQTENREIEAGLFEVVVTVTVTVFSGKEDKKTPMFVAEVKQAGIFLIKGIADKDLHRTLGAFCPNILFPYAREAIDSLVLRGSFPPLMLSPVNFDALYIKAQEKEQNKEASSAT